MKIVDHEVLSENIEGKSEPEIVEYILDLLNSLYADEPFIQNFLDFETKPSNIAERHFSIMSWLFNEIQDKGRSAQDFVLVSPQSVNGDARHILAIIKEKLKQRSQDHPKSMEISMRKKTHLLSEEEFEKFRSALSGRLESRQ
ncbi:MAG: hypothetical protein M1148_03040 [Candidatus Thermoplasmatota archaeon]|nr:hypothetical protein [Candidatus Thermoplasmatota archaeon]